MWNCPQCGSENDERTRFCGHCAAPRYVAQDGTVVVESPAVTYAASEVVPQPTARSSVGPGALLAMLIVAALGVVTYLAWQRGMLTLPTSLESYLTQTQPPAPAPPTPPATTGPVVPGERPPSEILSEMADMPRAQYGKFSTAVRQLEDVELQLKRVEAELPPQESDEPARQAQLKRLDTALPKLLETYKDFEEAALKANAAIYGDQVQQLREVYARAMLKFVSLLGRVYITDPDPARAEYGLEAKVGQAVAVYGRIPTEELHQRWLDAVHAREQHALDKQYTAEYKQLGAWLSTLRDLRGKFNAAAKQLPPAEMNFGRLTSGGRGLLELYDSFSTKLEQLWPEWRKFALKLPAKGLRPDKMDEQIEELELLFKSEHLDCFTQMYKIYSLDAELAHPAYTHLKDHFQFVKSNWSGSMLAYRGVFQKYEAEWEKNWKDGPPANPNAGNEEEGGRDLLGPPGFLPDLPPDGSS